MKSLLLTILLAAFANNCAFEQFFGVEPMLGFSKKESQIKLLGLSVTGVMLILAFLNLLIAPIFERFDLDHLRLMIYAAAILAIVYGMDWLLRKCGKTMGFYFPIVGLNSAVLALALNATQGTGFAAAIGAGIGFTVALLLMNGVQSKIEEDHVPAAFRGLPISLVAASIIAMVLVAFK